MNKPSTYEKEIERQNSAQADLVMKQNADPGKTMKAVYQNNIKSMTDYYSDKIEKHLLKIVKENA